MTNEIKQKIKQMKNSEVPEGYSHTKIGIFPDEWSVASFDDKFKRLDRKNDEDNQNVLTISAQQGLISQQDYYNSFYASENKKGYSLLYKGDFSYNKSYSGDYPYGAIKRLDNYEKGIVSPLYICFEPKEDTNSEFYLQYFETGLFNGEIYKIAQEGARNHGLLNVSVGEFFKTRLISPPCEEQQKIAEILMQCDKVIELKQKRIEEEKKLKRGLVNKIFNDLFFTKCDAVYKTFGEIFDIVTDYVSNGSFADLRNNVTYLEFGFAVLVRTADYNNNFKEDEFIYVDEHAYKFLANSVVYPGDIVISNVGSVGTVFKVPDLKKPMSLAPNTILVRTSNQNMEYMYQYLISPKGQDHIMSITSKTAMPKFNKTDFKNIKIRVHSLDEQLHIACALKAYDDKINLLEKELDQWKKKKKSLMQLLLTGIVRVKV